MSARHIYINIDGETLVPIVCAKSIKKANSQFGEAIPIPSPKPSPSHSKEKSQYITMQVSTNYKEWVTEMSSNISF
jgi:hypothetical protein